MWDGIVAIQKAKVERYWYEKAHPNDIDKCRCCGVLFSLIQYPKGCPLSHSASLETDAFIKRCEEQIKEQTK